MSASGAGTAVQPRIRLTRSFDERSHTYLGYLLRIAGTVGGVSAEFRVCIGSGTHANHQLRIGGQVEGLGHRVANSGTSAVDADTGSGCRFLIRFSGPVTDCLPRRHPKGRGFQATSVHLYPWLRVDPRFGSGAV
jgi:hypothetical protein